MTTKVENGMPSDRVSEYAKGTKNLYAWFVYDNFNEDTLEIEWLYLTQNHSIHTFQSKTGTDFGRGTFILEQPDDGWPTGNYRVIIRGRGISATIDFKITDGATVSVPVMLPGGQVELPAKAGWYLTGWDYLINPSDRTLQPNGYFKEMLQAGTTSKLYDSIQGTGEKNDFTVAISRTSQSGAYIAGSTSTSTWDDPPSYLAPGESPKLEVARSYQDNGTWGQVGMVVKFDNNDLPGPNHATSGCVKFLTPDGKPAWHTYSGAVETGKPIPAGKAGQLKAIWIALEGYGYRYTYEWRE